MPAFSQENGNLEMISKLILLGAMQSEAQLQDLSTSEANCDMFAPVFLSFPLALKWNLIL